MKAVAFIFARSGSKGLPGKNIKPLLGVPLIAWSILEAKKISRIDRVIVSTDCNEIANIAKEYGAEVPFIRPKELAKDDSPEWLAWRHAINFLKQENNVLPDVMLSLPATAPLRRDIDIENCLDVFEYGTFDSVITITEAHHSPYFNMVKKNIDGTVGLVIPPDNIINRRQDSPTVYDITTVAYAVDPQFILMEDSLFAGKVGYNHVPMERSVDIDTLLDFKMAEFFLTHRDQ